MPSGLACAKPRPVSWGQRVRCLRTCPGEYSGEPLHCPPSPSTPHKNTHRGIKNKRHAAHRVRRFRVLHPETACVSPCMNRTPPAAVAPEQTGVTRLHNPFHRAALATPPPPRRIAVSKAQRNDVATYPPLPCCKGVSIESMECRGVTVLHKPFHIGSGLRTPASGLQSGEGWPGHITPAVSGSPQHIRVTPPPLVQAL